LVIEEDCVQLVHRGGRAVEMELDAASAVELLQAAVAAAEDSGLAWEHDQIELTPKENLQRALEVNLIEF
jgi:hypothetical protein